MTKWAIELSEFDIKYAPRTAQKGQTFADFLVECHFRASIARTSWVDPIWEMHVDGASNFMGAGAGIVLRSSEYIQIECVVHLNFPASNNVIEYEALVTGLSLAKKLRIQRLQVYSDSQHIVELSNERYLAKDERMCKYRTLVRDLMREFEQISLIKVPCDENSRSDKLAKAASGLTEASAITKIEILEAPSISENRPIQRVMTVEFIPIDWRGKIVNYLEFKIQPEDPVEARKLKIKSARYLMIEGELFRRSFAGPHLRCLSPPQAKLVLTKIHKGSCRAHMGGRNLAYKVMAQGYYWPYLSREAEQYAKTCNKCQRHAPIDHSHAEILNTLRGPWPFALWGIDGVGPFPTTLGGFKHVLLATDYFTKWVEAESYTTITADDVVKFVWRNIICHFGIPKDIICDNGTQFNIRRFRAFCDKYNITL